jgi:hypothetical protein
MAEASGSGGGRGDWLAAARVPGNASVSGNDKNIYKKLNLHNKKRIHFYVIKK